MRVEYLVFLLILVLAAILFISFAALSGKIQKPIGGETDEHGCMLMAGYTWNEEVGACLREWELNDNQKQAAKIAAEYVNTGYGMTILNVAVARCPGCFAVKIATGDRQLNVYIENWEIATTKRE